MVKVVIKSPAVPVGTGDSVCEQHEVTYTKNKDEYRNYEDSYRHEIVFNREYVCIGIY
jgi:hypothetical protein